MKLLLLLLLTGCTASTTVYRDGKPTFRTNANCATLRLGADGSLAMTGVDHSTPQRAIGETITARGNALGGVIGALGASALIH